MCQYQGYEFGASYPDSVCIDGRLFDADNYADGLYFEPMQYWPCPMCHPWEYIVCRAEYNGECGFWGTVKSYYYAIRLTADIWKNRIFKTEPWKAPQDRGRED